MSTPAPPPRWLDDAERRRAARRAGYNGLAAVDVVEDGRALLLTFLTEPPGLRPENVRIDSDRRAADLHVARTQRADREDESRLRVLLDRPLSPSTSYTVRLVVAERGRPGEGPLPGFDPLSSSLPFRVPAAVAMADCVPSGEAPGASYPEPVLDYLAKDYAGFRQLLLDRLTLVDSQWQERHVPDLQVALVELLAYVGDYLSYYQDAVASEAYLGTARQRTSVRRHARLVDYVMHDGCTARAWVCLAVAEPFVLAAGSFCFATRPVDGTDWPEQVVPADWVQAVFPGGTQVFEPVVAGDVTLRPAHNPIGFWTWGRSRDQLPAGATHATLTDSAGAAAGSAARRHQPDEPEPRPQRVLDLRVGDVLVLEELLGGETGHAADANPTHRWPVRLTGVRQNVDPVFDQPVIEVEWATEDALPFPLPLCTLRAGDCVPVASAVARGNVVLVDAGATRSAFPGAVESFQVEAPPPPPGRAASAAPAPAADRPPPVPGWTRTLAGSAVTFRAPLPRPDVLGRWQARLIDTVLPSVAGRLATLNRTVGAGQPLDNAELAELLVLFGARRLSEARLVERADPQRLRNLPVDEQAERLHRLLANAGRLLAAKGGRFAELAARARAGLPLTDADIEEVAASVGRRYVTALRDHAALLGPAAEANVADPRAAQPAVTVTVTPPAGSGGPPTPTAWRVTRDLLASGPDDPDVVIEVDNDGQATLRFGDGRSGRALDAGSTVRLDYRTGNGSAGNVNADTIAHLIMLSGTAGGEVTGVRNPLPAAGGTDPEPIAEVRLQAPGQLRTVRLRAVTAQDYALLAQAVPGVQRAAATLRWTGTAHQARVAIDPLGGERLEPALRAEIVRVLDGARRIGHDLVVQPATYVPLDVELRIDLAPDADRHRVQEAVAAAFGSGVLPSGGRGFFHPDNLTFGTRIPVSRLVATACAIPGVRNAAVTRLHRWGQGDRGELALGVLAVRPLEIPRLDSDGDPAHGRFRLASQTRRVFRRPIPTPPAPPQVGRGGEAGPAGPGRPGGTGGPGGAPSAVEPAAPAVSDEPGATAVQPLPAAPAPPMLLRIDEGNTEREEYPLVQDITTVGRGRDMDIRIDPEATLVSRRHARLLRVGDGADVEDLGSTNGTTLNGRPVHLAHLSDGDEIRIGEVRLRYRAGGVSGAGGTAVPGEDAETPPDCTADPGPPPSPPPLPSSQGGQP